MRRFLPLLLGGLIFLLPFAARAEGPVSGDASTVAGAPVTVDDQFRLFVDGVEIKPDKDTQAGPIVKDGEVFVPIRFVVEHLDAKVEWIDKEKVARIIRGVDSVRIGEGDTQVKTGVDVWQLKSPPFVYNERLMVPLTITAKGLGMAIEQGKTSLKIISPSSGKGTTADLAITTLAAVLWALALAVLALRLSPASKANWGELTKADLGVILFTLLLVAPLVAFFARSHGWAAMVPAGSALAGILSRETFHNRLATMASSAMGLGILGTMLGLGFIIGPAVANHDVTSIGFGISVKIEASVTGLGLSWIYNTLWGYASRE